jgi:alpha-D-ribose 1-methylphosphonate 5-triphosphate diphosphatase
VLLDWPEGGTPGVRQTFVNGRAAYGATAAG